MSDIKNTLKYGFEDLIKNYKLNRLIIINIFILFYITTLLFNQLSGVYIGYKEISNNIGYITKYNLIRTSEDNNYNYSTVYEEQTLDKYKEFYKWLNNSFNTEVIIPCSAEEVEIKNAYFVNEGFISNILDSKLTCINDELKKSYGNYIPIIIGNLYSDIYKVGDIINKKYYIEGILKKDSTYFDFRKGYRPILLDNKIFIPIQIDEMNILEYSRTIEEIFLNIEDNKCLQQINNKVEELGIDKFNFISQSNQYLRCIESDKGFLNFNMFFYINILIVCVIATICIIIEILKRNKQNFIQHFICGASRKDIIIRVFFTQSIIVFISLVFCSFFSIIFLKFSISDFILSIFFTLITGLVITFSPVIILLDKDYFKS